MTTFLFIVQKNDNFLFLSSSNDDNFFFLSFFMNNDNFLDMILFLVRKKILQVMHILFFSKKYLLPLEKYWTVCYTSALCKT